MPNFKFAKGFFTGMLITEAAVATGLLFLTWHAFKSLKSEKDYSRPLERYGRYDSYAEYRKHEQDKEFL